MIFAAKYTGKLIVVSFDGFRWDYTRFAETPHFDSLEENGTRVDYMIGVFPTKSFPSHVSLATGENCHIFFITLRKHFENITLEIFSLFT